MYQVPQNKRPKLEISSLQRAVVVVFGLIVGIFVGRLSALFFGNGYGFAMTPLLAVPLIFITGVSATVGFVKLTKAFFVERPWIYLASMIMMIWLFIVLYPVACDTHESWNDIPNQKCSCQGLTVEYYLSGIFDGASTDYCLGFEQ